MGPTYKYVSKFLKITNTTKSFNFINLSEKFVIFLHFSRKLYKPRKERKTNVGNC